MSHAEKRLNAHAVHTHTRKTTHVSGCVTHVSAQNTLERRGGCS